jgi:hypothetical protein
LVLTALLNACAAPQPVPNTTLALPTAAIASQNAPPTTVPTETLAPEEATPEPEATRPERTLYQVDVSMAGVSTMHVELVINYLNTSNETLENLPFILFAPLSWYRFEGILGGEPSYSPIRDYDLEEGLLSVPLNTPLEPGERRQLTLYYQLSTPPRGLSGYAARQAHFVYWYPFVPPPDPDGGWLVHAAGEVGEWMPQEQADFEVTIHVDNAALQVIAPGTVTVMDTGAHVSLANARHMMFTLSSELEFSEQDVDGILVRSWYYPEHTAAGKQALQTVSDSLRLYQEIYGPYPYDSFTVMESYVQDGLEGDAGFFLDAFYYAQYDGTPQNLLTALCAHETAHAWFYGMVGNDPALEPWLDEALATNSERLYYERYYPELVGWWWDFRVNVFKPGGWVNSTIYDHREFRPYVNAVYLRGARFLGAVNESMGDETYFQFLGDYVSANRDNLATSVDFFDLLAEHSEDNLTLLIENYFTPWR